MKTYRKILLIIPNFHWDAKENRTIWNIQPFGLCMLASSMGDAYEVSIMDANFYNLSRVEFQRRVRLSAPDLVGISVLTTEYGVTGHIAAQLVKQVNPAIPIILGGVYATTECEEIADQNIDYIFAGEGELAFREFVDSLNGSPVDLSTCSLSQNRHGRPLIRAHAIEDLDALPLPAYHLIDYPAYASTSPRESVDEPRAYPYGRIMTSRGCPLNCIFCQVNLIMGKTFRKRSPESIIREIDFLRDRYGIKYLVFDDDNLFLDKKRAMELFRMMIDRDYNMGWHPIATAVYALDEEVLTLARQSGLQYVDLAVESGVKRVLKEIINKPVDLDHAKMVVDICRRLGINSAVNFIVGFPGETWDEIRQTLTFASELNADYTKLFIANPLPGTRLHRLAETMGVLTDNSRDCSWFMGKIRTDQFTPLDLAILRAYEWDRINFALPEKRRKIASMMNISEGRLDEIRSHTRQRAGEIIRAAGQ
ncbi:MAG: B12-binding domain-containing radical SAM protein [Thermodesulfobacteriota bacterium]